VEFILFLAPKNRSLQGFQTSNFDPILTRVFSRIFGPIEKTLQVGMAGLPSYLTSINDKQYDQPETG
jgi:hypothetical protein